MKNSGLILLAVLLVSFSTTAQVVTKSNPQLLNFSKNIPDSIFNRKLNIGKPFELPNTQPFSQLKNQFREQSQLFKQQTNANVSAAGPDRMPVVKLNTPSNMPIYKPDTTLTKYSLRIKRF